MTGADIWQLAEAAGQIASQVVAGQSSGERLKSTVALILRRLRKAIPDPEARGLFLQENFNLAAARAQLVERLNLIDAIDATCVADGKDASQ